MKSIEYICHRWRELLTGIKVMRSKAVNTSDWSRPITTSYSIILHCDFSGCCGYVRTPFPINVRDFSAWISRHFWTSTLARTEWLDYLHCKMEHWVTHREACATTSSWKTSRVVVVIVQLFNAWSWIRNRPLILIISSKIFTLSLHMFQCLRFTAYVRGERKDSIRV